MKIKRTLSASLMGAALIAVHAWTPAQASSWLKVEGSVNLDATTAIKGDHETKLRARDAELRFEILLREGIRIVVKTELERILAGQKIDRAELERFVEEAYIQIETDKFGMPRAVVTAGKHQMAFGQNITELPMFKDRLLYDLAKQDEVIGLTVALPTNFLKIVDSVAVSIFESKAGDFQISDKRGASIKLTKALSKQLEAQVSYMMKENEGRSDTEHRGSLGFVFTSSDGQWKIWTEGVVVRANPIHGDTWGATVGGSYKVGPGAVVVEYSYLRDSAHEVAVAYNLPVGRHMVLSPEVRHRMDLTGTGTDETVIGLRTRLQFQVESGKRLKKGPGNL